ncbi:hypothetical protein F2Q69_00050819 [Brassica cretica]|uniref:Uncharacterized protein n=1 Tax=Brassica cretica TaxID=69181 RepID=A0A8S9PL02_BRACR|nr:hypothetical protein F2Q69_00050819 [Brassica cretica]
MKLTIIALNVSWFCHGGGASALSSKILSTETSSADPPPPSAELRSSSFLARSTSITNSDLT